MICNQCARRKCKTEAVYNQVTGRFKCRSFLQPNNRWSMLELALDSSPVATLSLLHQVGLEAVETEKGYKVKYARHNSD